MNEELKNLFDRFSDNIDKRFDSIDNHLTQLNERLDSMIDKKEKDN